MESFSKDVEISMARWTRFSGVGRQGDFQVTWLITRSTDATEKTTLVQG